jgi:plasmid stabilization system protein ParE
VGSHFVFYKIVEPDKQIAVMRVLHQKMNLSARLGRH